MRGLKVAHTNFSEETIGEFYADLYSSEDSKCIKCLRRNCNGIFTPREFCMHYHGLLLLTYFFDTNQNLNLLAWNIHKPK